MQQYRSGDVRPQSDQPLLVLENLDGPPEAPTRDEFNQALAVYSQDVDAKVRAFRQAG